MQLELIFYNLFRLDHWFHLNPPSKQPNPPIPPTINHGNAAIPENVVEDKTLDTSVPGHTDLDIPKKSM